MQQVTLPMTVGVVLANAVLTVQKPWSSRIFPHLGAGVVLGAIGVMGDGLTVT